MKVASFEAVVRALNEAEVPFIVVGGLAVNIHGHGRATYDVDLVVRLESDVILRTFTALAKLGYAPLAPVRAEEFADTKIREQLMREKGMLVLQFHSEQHRETRVDVFVREPFEFSQEWARSREEEIEPGLKARFVSLETLMAMKENAGRPKDLEDLRVLRWGAEQP